ncbi:MAG: M28 family metallopeptidase [Promethearchaeota archaeon]
MIDEKLMDYMYDFIKDICENIGPREAGTEQELLAGDKIEAEFKKFCDTTNQEEYMSSPHAFLGGIRYNALLVLVAIILYWLVLLNDLSMIFLSSLLEVTFLILAIILILIAVSYFILEVMKYYEVFDIFFPKRKSRNVIGIINPSGEAKRDMIFSTHHDSAFEFNTFYYLKRFGQVIINVGYVGVAVVLIGIILKVIFLFLDISLPLLFLVLGIVFACFTPIVFVYVFFHGYKPVLGAFDNLSGVAVLLGIGNYLASKKNDPSIFPQSTRVLLVSFAGEEAGLRGSKRYLRAHEDELKKNNAVVVNMDSIGSTKVIIIHDKESGIGAKHDPRVYEELYDIAKKINPSVKIAPLPFGATDGATFSKASIPCASLGSLNLVDELVPYYHTRLDTPDVVEKEALGQFLKICLEYLKRIDK